VPPLLAVFGLPATVTRPAPDDTPIATTAIWVTEAMEESRPFGTDFQRREPRRLLALPRADLATLPRGTVIAVPEMSGAASKAWRVDGLDQVDPQFWRVIVTVVS
jgi:hypothetical protein